jgi:hypothetical protein
MPSVLSGQSRCAPTRRGGARLMKAWRRCVSDERVLEGLRSGTNSERKLRGGRRVSGPLGKKDSGFGQMILRLCWTFSDSREQANKQRFAAAHSKLMARARVCALTFSMRLSQTDQAPSQAGPA